jgi:hypothetical protein
MGRSGWKRKSGKKTAQENQKKGKFKKDWGRKRNGIKLQFQTARIKTFSDRR